MMIVPDVNLEVCELISQDSVIWLFAQRLQCIVHGLQFNRPVVLSTSFMMIVVNPISVDRACELVSRTVRFVVEPEDTTDDLEADDIVSVRQVLKFVVMKVCIGVYVYLPVLVSRFVVVARIF